MIRTLIQFRDAAGNRHVGLMRNGVPSHVVGASTTLQLARRALAQGVSLAELAEASAGGLIDLDTVTLLAPIDHEDPARLLLSGTGLTHLGSAEGRDRMHRKMTDAAQQTDSMKMFLMGVQDGKPPAGVVGVQPEWFYKGDGTQLVAPGDPLPVPDFGLDAGEEPEIAGIYLIADDGSPVRLGFALGNEFSDHVVERHNYLWLAHSKLRPAALGPILLALLHPQANFSVPPNGVGRHIDTGVSSGHISQGLFIPVAVARRRPAEEVSLARGHCDNGLMHVGHIGGVRPVHFSRPARAPNLEIHKKRKARTVEGTEV